MEDFGKTEAILANMVGSAVGQVPGLGAFVIKNGQKVFSFCGGNAYLDSKNPSKNRPFTDNSLFRIASVSKQYTVYAIMQLVEQNKLKLDDEAGQYLGFELIHPKFPVDKITIRMLADHTSGLRDGIIYCIPPEYSLKEFFQPDGRFYEDGGHFSSANEPVGQYFCYCNLNYGLLGTVIEAVTNQRFDKYMAEHVLKPLGIDGGYLPANLTPKEFSRLGTLYQKQDEQGNWNDNMPWRGVMDCYTNQQPPHDTVTMQNPYALKDDSAQYTIENYRIGSNATFFAPQGGLRMSLNGLENTLLMLMGKGKLNNKVFLSEKSFNEITNRQWWYHNNNGDTGDGTLLSYGLGLYHIDGESSSRVCRDKCIDLVGHTGQAFGLYAGLFFVPGTRNGFGYIINGIGMSEEDNRSAGRFSGNFVWEETIMNALCAGLYYK